ncbi:MAG TPA: hypothetical protein VHO07_10450 [Streptosporangiaceae bacterium]|jgi:hypothetical protein|nr:hypothetical protein [Streptosporangiaceae bacterium]
MNIDQAEPTATTADAGPGGATPLLRTLGDAGAAVCADGFCVVPPTQEVAPGQEVALGLTATTGAGE